MGAKVTMNGLVVINFMCQVDWIYSPRLNMLGMCRRVFPDDISI